MNAGTSPRRRRAGWLLAVCAGLAGCASLPTTAVVNGVEVPRLTQEYQGQPYVVRHTAAHPQPGGPSGGLVDNGGKISGQICGMDVDYQVHHKGDHILLVGFLDQTKPTQIQIRDQAGERVITGNLENAAVNLHLRSNSLEGTSGFRAFKMVQDGDRLVGKMRSLNTDDLGDVTVNGRDELWALPPAAQAAVLPAMLACFVAKIGNFGRSPLVVGFGGKGGAQPRESSSLYQR